MVNENVKKVVDLVPLIGQLFEIYTSYSNSWPISYR